MEIFNIKNKDCNQYFGCKIPPKSPYIEQIRTLPVRYWNKELNLWLVPYNTENWTALKSLFKNEDIHIDSSERQVSVSLYSKDDKVNTIPKPQKIASKPLTELSQSHSLAILKMKEQLIINRYQESTLKSYLTCMTEFFVYYNKMDASVITIEDIRSYMLHKINGDKIKENTQNSLINAIKFYYEKVEKREKFFIYDLRPRRPSQLPGFLSKEDTVKLLTCTNNIKHRAILQLIYSSGMRLGELTRLKVRDIKFDMDIIEIKCAKGKKDRITKLSAKVKVLLTEYISQYQPKYYLFEGQTGGKYSDRSVQNIMQNAVIKSGVDENATVHTLRHTFATHLILDGMDIRTVQELLGHNSPETTAIYTHITDKMKKDVKSPLDNLDI